MVGGAPRSRVAPHATFAPSLDDTRFQGVYQLMRCHTLVALAAAISVDKRLSSDNVPPFNRLEA
jgi:hypothetical protein